MMAVPGTFDGQRFQDLRVLIGKPIREYYEQQGLWENIVLYRSYELTEVIVLKTTYGYTKHRWKQHPYRPHARNHGWYIDSEERSREKPTRA